MFNRAHTTIPPLPPAAPSYMSSTWLTGEPVPHHIPDWIKVWTEPDLPSLITAIELLNQLHADLLTEAEYGPGHTTYVHAAKQVSLLLNIVTTPSVARGEANVVDSISRFVAALVRVLRDWDDTTTECELYKTFGLTEGWIDHARGQLNAAIARRNSESTASLL